ncbi:MAG: hypothetical protein IT320_04200 [Anaerolineae bacterium]|nr:hypothetical protein [Anaerolineae bacterium]
MASVHVDWDDEDHQILRYVFEPRWDWEDFFKAVAEARAMMDSAPGNVGVIFDAADAPNINVPQNALTNFRNALKRAHDKNKLMVVVLNSAFARIVISSVKKLGGDRASSLQFAPTVDDARRMIENHLQRLAAEKAQEPISAD